MKTTYNDGCSVSIENFVNTGANSQCLEAVTVLLILAKDSFRFDSLSDFRDKAKWEEAIKNKDIVPLFELYELTSANTEETFYESRNFRKRTAKAAKVTTVESYLSICSHRALKAYHESTTYNRVFEVTEEGDIIGVWDSDMIKIKGQKLKSFNVGIRNPATTEKPPFTPITITYNDYNELETYGVITKPDFDPIDDLNGIYNVAIREVGVATTTEIKFTVMAGCGEQEPVEITPLTSFKFTKESDGSDVPITVTYDAATHIYTATGTGLEDGTLRTDGVITDPVTNEMFEGSGFINITDVTPQSKRGK